MQQLPVRSFGPAAVTHTHTIGATDLQQCENLKLRWQLTRLEILASESLYLWTAQPVLHPWFWTHHPGNQKQFKKVSMTATVPVFTRKLKCLQLSFPCRLVACKRMRTSPVIYLLIHRTIKSKHHLPWWSCRTPTGKSLLRQTISVR